MVFLSIMSTANLFPKQSGVVLMIMNGSYGGGALVFLIFNWIYFQYHVTLRSLFLVYAGIAGFIALIVLFTWPLKKYKSPIDESEQLHADVDAKTEHTETSKFRRVIKSVFNIHYLFLNITVAILILKSNYYLATSDIQLGMMSSNGDEIALYAKIFGLMMPIIGFLVGPIGIVVDKAGVDVSGIFLVILSGISSFIGFIEYLPIQVINFFVFSMYFPYIYGYWCSFIVVKFGFEDYGVLYAGVAITAGVVNLAGIPLATYPDTQRVNLVLLIVNSALLIYPIASLIHKRVTHKHFLDGERERLLLVNSAGPVYSDLPK